MKVSDILRLKGAAIYTVAPGQAVFEAVRMMVELDLGSVLVMDDDQMSGILTFREILLALDKAKGELGRTRVSEAMNREPLTCSPEVEIDEVRRMMLERHCRYMPVLDHGKLVGVVSFYDVAKAVVDSQHLENKLLKAYIRDWPVDS